MRPNQNAARIAADQSDLGRPLVLALGAAACAAAYGFSATGSLALAVAAYCVAGSISLVGFAALLNR